MAKKQLRETLYVGLSTIDPLKGLTLYRGQRVVLSRRGEEFTLVDFDPRRRVNQLVVENSRGKRYVTSVHLVERWLRYNAKNSSK